MDRFTFLIFLIAFLVFSCNPHNNKSLDEANESTLNNYQNDLILTTHIIDVKCDGEFIPIRERILTRSELMLSQKNNEAAKKLNNEVIIDRLYNGEWIKILKADTSGYHYIQVIDRTNSTEHDNQRNIRGFIIAEFCGKPTVRKFEKIHISEFDSSSSDVKSLLGFLEYHNPNGDLLDYAYSYISQEADLIQTLSFNVTGNNTIYYRLYQVFNQHDAFLCTGTAELTSRYRKGESEYSKYITSNLTGTDFEIHINDSKNNASLKLIDKKMTFLYEEEGLTMERIK